MISSERVLEWGCCTLSLSPMSSKCIICPLISPFPTCIQLVWSTPYWFRRNFQSTMLPYCLSFFSFIGARCSHAGSGEKVIQCTCDLLCLFHIVCIVFWILNLIQTTLSIVNCCNPRLHCPNSCSSKSLCLVRAVWDNNSCIVSKRQIVRSGFTVAVHMSDSVAMSG